MKSEKCKNVKGAKEKLNKGLRGKEKDSRGTDRNTGADSGLDSVGKPVSEQTLGSRLHYCFSALLAEVLSLGLISKTCA